MPIRTEMISPSDPQITLLVSSAVPFSPNDRFYALERGQIVLEESTSSPAALDGLMKAVSV